MFTLKKGQEISYLILKSSVFIRRFSFKQKLEHWSFELLENVALSDFEKGLRAVNVLETLINFGKQIYEIEPVNVEIIIKELSTLKSAMRQFAGLDELPNFNSNNYINYNNNGQATKENAKNNEKSDINEQFGNAANGILRQSLIIQKMRQGGKSEYQIKDFLDMFPDTSERTLRYDLQKLLGSGLVDRVGNGGPGTGYVIKA